MVMVFNAIFNNTFVVQLYRGSLFDKIIHLFILSC